MREELAELKVIHKQENKEQEKKREQEDKKDQEKKEERKKEEKAKSKTLQKESDERCNTFGELQEGYNAVKQ